MESHICGVSSYIYVHVICLTRLNLIYSSMLMPLLCRLTRFFNKITWHFYTTGLLHLQLNSPIILYCTTCI